MAIFRHKVKCKSRQRPHFQESEIVKETIQDLISKQEPPPIAQRRTQSIYYLRCSFHPALKYTWGISKTTYTKRYTLAKQKEDYEIVFTNI